jgi:hypothetical protein
MTYGLELPSPTIPLEQTRPRVLLNHNASLGYFASAAIRLAPHIALAAQPDTPRLAADIAAELVEVATPAVNLEPEAADHVGYRLSLLFFPGREDSQYITSVRLGKQRQRAVVHSEAGRAVVPTVALLAARWLVDREATEKLLPASVARRWHHGTRFACLQHCLSASTSIGVIARDLGLTKPSVKQLFGQFRSSGLVVRGDTYHQAVYGVADDIRPMVVAIASELHSLKDPAYSDVLRSSILRQIVQTPAFYGALAHAALTEIANTRRPQRALNTNWES